MDTEEDPAPHAAALLAGLASTPHLVALFDADDRLQWCNRAFREVYAIDAGEHPTWIELMRHNHHSGQGTRVETADFEAWLASAASRRAKQAYRAFEADVHGGRWFWMSEQMLPDGSLLCIAHDVTPLRTDERTLRQARDLAQRQANTDPLTGLGNRRHVMDALSAALAPPRRAGSFLALVDLDHFKRINDAHGHHGGDLVLRDFARVLLAVMRRDDIMGRIGGEEFLVLLPAVGRDAALAVAQRLGAATRAAVPLPEQPAFRYTCSIGLVAVDGTSSLDHLLRCADQALYAAKAAGRDRCVLHAPADASGMAHPPASAGGGAQAGA